MLEDESPPAAKTAAFEHVALGAHVGGGRGFVFKHVARAGRGGGRRGFAFEHVVVSSRGPYRWEEGSLAQGETLSVEITVPQMAASQAACGIPVVPGCPGGAETRGGRGALGGSRQPGCGSSPGGGRQTDGVHKPTIPSPADTGPESSMLS